jgi:wyosine [tRNA(Phe)-imidazoG37] synthetase (radical SAM superfamily)
MPTFLFDEIIFGPVKSRRLGISLGINLLPVSSKLCNFNCVYCECGLSGEDENEPGRLPGRSEVYKALEQKLTEMKHLNQTPDVITYAGNGEPTLHPGFAEIIDDSILLRNRYFPEAKIAVLSNGTRISDKKIRNALLKVDQNILKLDSAISSTITINNQPSNAIIAEDLIENLAAFEGRLLIQTLFLRGFFRGKRIDNTTSQE